MSDSRLEKFIYAICSMDVSDLPVPLSRIEKLWNCLITGETPDFEPLSRNEKYLMAMLDRYDISNLPAPMSRGEKLLYKIAVGETDLSDVPGYLSRYEELLKYLIENGVLSDFEYVLYTLNQSLSTLYATVEKPVKSAILKGNTLVNISNINKFSLSRNERLSTKNKVQVGKTYLQVIAITKNTLSPANDKGNVASINDSDGVNNFANDYYRVAINETGILKKVYTVTSTSGKNDTSLRTYSITTEGVLEGYEMLIEYQEGMENWDIPYFDGMQSVKMPVLKTTGKNLWDKKNFVNGVIDGESIRVSASDLDDTRFYYDFKENQQYVFTLTSYSENKKLVYFRYNYTDGTNSGFTFFIPYNGEKKHFLSDEGKTISYISFVFSDHDNYTLSNVQLEEGSVATSYEPYKTNILTTPSDLELRGIGDVRDELNCLTGEVINNVGKFIFDGTHDYGVGTTGDVTRISISNVNARPKTQPICDKLKTILYVTSDQLGDELACIHHTNDRIDIYILTSKCGATIDEIKAYLTTNPITVQYQLETESVKTVDLTTIDQDGQPTKLKTFNDITNVEIKADSLIPSVDLEVATKISETLSTLGLEHHDISETQNKLGQTIDEQTENTDATMLATTEIYENL